MPRIQSMRIAEFWLQSTTSFQYRNVLRSTENTYWPFVVRCVATCVPVLNANMQRVNVHSSGSANAESTGQQKDE